MNENITCLLIDDDTDDQEIFALAIGVIDAPIICHFANNGVQALEKLKDESFIPDCIFLDLNMPQMNGKQCLMELKKISRLRKVPVFIYSSSSDEKITAEIKLLGAYDYIVKPSNIVELTDILTMALDTSKKAQVEN